MSEAREQMSQVYVNKDFVEKKKNALVNDETLCSGILERYLLSLLLLVEPTHPRFYIYRKEACNPRHGPNTWGQASLLLLNLYPVCKRSLYS